MHRKKNPHISCRINYFLALSWKTSLVEMIFPRISTRFAFQSKRKTALRSGEITETSTIGFSPECGTGAPSLFLLLEGEGWHHTSNGRWAMWGLKMRDITLKQPSKLVISSQESIIWVPKWLRKPWRPWLFSRR